MAFFMYINAIILLKYLKLNQLSENKIVLNAKTN